MPATHLISVDLPAPLSPTSAITSPCAHLEVDVGQRLHRAERLRDAAKLEQRRWSRQGCCLDGISAQENATGRPRATASVDVRLAVYLQYFVYVAVADVALLQEAV